ncbi:hypothetical protein LGL08_22105 [Clostridium estertheticum]|uniref:hypothetical protein n=1 Tax=Clostridium estertheticum TaxID=238834 RepID=UPI001CF576BC|nr:hypothetical protein [Clostridium estertheticum]MCB2309270.1 hypothetical protein [Clostridium estertheticum]MCB2346803.1 hypothetical protein [Clostridium estertheticum]MCB2352219.1 hypothetical protein [Clostridium estertheticum]WAG48542.1 hypothetical protein LL127_23695 [Clostridium estertheticum]
MRNHSLGTIFINFVITSIVFVAISMSNIFFKMSIKEAFASAVIFNLLDLIIFGIRKVVRKKNEH